ncbi:hypothetical protein DCCM_3626 [Desulfocucumis palustris]|uniref:Uncharacterized protein n=1 Tax=Desulfocucumis palustris TaxID=1898651 RepID=A0A2L2XE43_9FIRM|nr:hypothetical protein [Desulfocucumis palustris]GBF34508.1 hypothetical protein DCCM_3626 [Desulfocucumis palustris]
MSPWKKIILKYTENIDTVLPGESTPGEPFWALMEIKDGRNTGNYHSMGNRFGKTMLMLFPQKKMADWAARQLSEHVEGFEVRGISGKHLEVLLGLYEDGQPIELIVAASGLDDKGELQGASMTPGQIRDFISFDW